MKISTEKHGELWINGASQETLLKMLDHYGAVSFLEQMCREGRVTKNGKRLKQY
jgi:hypothetical protein